MSTLCLCDLSLDDLRLAAELSQSAAPCRQIEATPPPPASSQDSAGPNPVLPKRRVLGVYIASSEA